jgi:hypothetical protein
MLGPVEITVIMAALISVIVVIGRIITTVLRRTRQ